MFHYLKGTVAHREPGLTVIDCGGVGFACHTSLQTTARVKMGEVFLLYTHVVIREDAFDIYAFHDTSERDCFRLLTGITGVGPKVALSILSENTPERLALGILGGDENVLTSASGVGKKLAQRIILELKDKFGSVSSMADTGGFVEASAPAVGLLGEAQAALMVLGYSAAEAGMALRGIAVDGMTVEQVIKQALKNTMSKI